MHIVKTLLVRDPTLENLQIVALGPGGRYSMPERILWNLTENPELSPELQAELDAQQAAESAEKEANEYKSLRAREYPSIEDQLDMLYHGGLDAWKADIKKIKDKYPKG